MLKQLYMRVATYPCTYAGAARQAASRRLPKRFKIALLLLIAFFAVEFFVRGPVRFIREAAVNDFIPPFVQAKALVRGKDPYDPQEVLSLWPKDAAQPGFLSIDAAAGAIEARDGIPSPYPLSCLAVLSPISGIPWRFAHLVVLAGNVLSSLLLIGILLSLSGLESSNPRSYVFLALALGLAPLQTALAVGNLIVPACTCGVAAMWCSTRNRHTLAGVLAGIATCLKPPVGVVFLVYAVVRRRWRLLLVGSFLSTVVTTAAVLWLWISGTPWVSAYLRNVKQMFAVGAINDFTGANPLRFHLLNLQMPMYRLTGSAVAADQITWSIVAILLLVWVWVVMRPHTHSELLELSAIATIALLPHYHRFVDGMLLALPLCWCFAVRDEHLKLVSRLVMFLLLPFLVPGSSLLTKLADARVFRVPATWWWDAVLVAHETWAVLAIGGVLLYAMTLSGLDERTLRDNAGSAACTTIPLPPQAALSGVFDLMELKKSD